MDYLAEDADLLGQGLLVGDGVLAGFLPEDVGLDLLVQGVEVGSVLL